MKTDREEKYQSFLDTFKNLSSQKGIPAVRNQKKYLIITQCSKGKIQERTEAKNIYKSLQVKYLADVANIHEDHFDMAILSAGYGWLDQDDIISPYEQSFNTLSKGDVLKLSREVGLREEFERLCDGYDMVFIALGDKYLHALDLEKPFWIPSTLVFIIPDGKRDTKEEPKGNTVENYYTNIKNTTTHGASMINLKGRILQGFIKRYALREGIDRLGGFSREEFEYYIEHKEFK